MADTVMASSYVVDESVTLWWEPTAGGLEGIQYEGEVSFDGGTAWQTLFELQDAPYFLWVTDTLPQDTLALVRVRAWDGEIYGGFSYSESILIHHAPPAPDLHTYPEGVVDASVRVAWQDPQTGGVVFEGFVRPVGGEWQAAFGPQEETHVDWFTATLLEGEYELGVRSWDGVLHSEMAITEPFRIEHLADWMWERIPESTRERDYSLAKVDAPLDREGRGKGPLRELVDILGYGLASARQSAARFGDVVDVDRCPEHLLPHLAALLGFEFPYDLSEERQRGYLRSAISLYKSKGTERTLRLAALRILGQGFDIRVENEDYQNRTVDVVLTADEDAATAQLEQKFRYMVDAYTPAGMVPDVRVVYYFTDALDTGRQEDGLAYSVEQTSWRFNFAGHLLNQTARSNDFGEHTHNF